MLHALISPEPATRSCALPVSAHSWMPVSPCGPSCVETPARAGSLRVATRLAGIAGVLISFPLAHYIAPRRKRAAVQRWYARTLLSCCGIRLRIVDRRGTAAEDGALIVARHIGWTDVLALTAVEPMGFVARADLVDWPALGDIARRVRVIPIERERLRTLPDVVDAVARRLGAGERVAFFPEGTTWCGRAHGGFRPALFQAAVESGKPVQPIRLRYLDHHGELSTVPGFVGADSLIASVRRVLRSRGVSAEIVLEPLEAPGTDRHDLARRCERAVTDSVEHAFADVIHASEGVEAVGGGAVRRTAVAVRRG